MRHHHIAQATETANADYRPTGKVYCTRGFMRWHDNPRGSGRNWRGEWDEKYIWGGQPGESHLPSKAPGVTRDPSLTGPVEIPYITSINVSNSQDVNGIAQATVEIINEEWEEDTLSGFMYHILREGFFSPFPGADTYADVESDTFKGKANDSGSVWIKDGKVISNVLLPNRKIEIFQGYGNELQRTFVGLIDTVDVDMKTKKISVNASSFGRVLSDVSFTPPVVPRYPVAFGDRDYWTGVGDRDKWQTAPKTMFLVDDITKIAGYLLGWAGFQKYRSVKAGRIGVANTAGVIDPGSKHDAVFREDHFDKSSYLIDGLNMVKELLGYNLYVTAGIHTASSVYGRYRDPTVYDAAHSKDTIGMPYFAPDGIWRDQSEESAEQFNVNLTDARLTYSGDSLRKSIYVVSPDSNAPKGQKKMGYSAPYELMSGIPRIMVYNVEQEAPGLHLSETEINVFMRMAMIKSMMYYARAEFTVPGYPADLVNQVIDAKEPGTKTWRRFFVTGYSSSMTLGPNATYSTTFSVVNSDNIFIKRVRQQIDKIIGKRDWNAYKATDTRDRDTCGG